MKHIPYLDRRMFLNQMAKSCLGVAAVSPLLAHPTLAALEAVAGTRSDGKAKSVIFLFMMGGQSHIDTWDPKPGSETQGPIDTISTPVAGLQLGEHLVRTARQARHLAVIRSMTSKEGSHPRGQYQLHTNYPPLGTMTHPSMGAWMLKTAGRMNDEIPGNITIGRSGYGAGYFGSEFEPFRIVNPEQALHNVEPPDGVDTARETRRRDLLDDLDSDFRARYPHKSVATYTRYYREAVRMMHSDDVQAFDVLAESDATRSAYGGNPFGLGVLLSRRLVERGVRYIEVAYNGWDTHQDNFERVGELTTNFDQAYSALLADLHSRGLLDETLVVVATEFGRTPRINGNNGRDHYPRAFSAVLAGGGIRGGQVYGGTDASGGNVIDKPVTLMDLNATIAHAAGVDHSTKVRSPSGRPFTMCDKGQPITALF